MCMPFKKAAVWRWPVKPRHGVQRPHHLSGRIRWPLITGVTVLAAVLRAAASFNDLWLDEVWTLWLIAQLVHEPSDIVRGFMRHDNNHLLNTLWMYLLGPHLPSIIYRLPSVVAGSLAVVPAALIGRSRGPLTAVACGAAFAIDFMLVNLGSEARGYSVMSLCVVVAQWLALEHGGSGAAKRGQHGSWQPILFNACCIIGFLAHLSFVFCFAAIAAWALLVSLVEWRGDRGAWRQIAGEYLAWYATPAAAAGLLYVGFVRQMGFGGGSSDGAGATAIAALAAIVGCPLVSPWQFVAAAVGATAGTVCLLRCWWASWRRGAFFLLAIVLVPIAVITAFPVAYYSVRYFLVPAQTMLLLVASELPRQFGVDAVGAVSTANRRRGGLACLVILGVAFAMLNLARDAVLIVRGRGQIAETLRWIVEHSQWPGPVITCSSNQEFRTRLLIAYHGERLPGRKMRLYSSETLPTRGAEWYIVNDQRDLGVGAERADDVHGNTYEKVHEMRSGGLSPAHWHVYRSIAAP